MESAFLGSLSSLLMPIILDEVKKKKKLVRKGPPKGQLILATNRKTKFSSNHQNTFGLTFGLPKDGGTCPGATEGLGGCLNVREGCKRQTCYMSKVCQIYKAVGRTLDVNTKMLVGKSYEEMLLVLTNTFEAFKNKNKKENWFFRLTYSGDIFSEEFAKAVKEACKLFPDIQFWIYTRSHSYVEILSQASNLAVYLSVDPVNATSGYAVYEQLKDRKNVGLAWLGGTKELPYKFVTCPETSGKLKNTDQKGACSNCRLCFRYSDKIKLRNIGFVIH